MNKKSTDVAIIIFIAVMFFVGIRYGMPDSGAVGSVSEERLLEIEESRNASDDDLVDELFINGSKAHKNDNTDQWLCEISDDFSGTGFMSISFRKRSPGVRLAFANRESLAIEEDEPLIIIAYTPFRYKTYEIHLTTLPVMELVYFGDVLNTEDTAAVFEGYSGKTHIRGATTSEYPKKAYKLTLDEKCSFLDLRKDDDWILYPAYNDQDRVRNVFSSNLWYESCAGDNGFKVKNGFEFRYIELFVNGHYSGLYALGYKPDQKQFEIGKGEYLYSKIKWGNMGYELQGSKTKKNESAAWQTLQERYVYDVSSNTDLWLFVNLIAGMDNAGKNYYLALKKGDMAPVAVVCPWDMDMTWGNYYDGEDENGIGENYIAFDTPCFMTEGFIWQQLGENREKTVKMLQEKYSTLREKYWSDEHLNELMDEYEKEIFDSGAYARDIKLWSESNHHDISIGLSDFREFVLNRSDWMDHFMESLS